MRRTLIIFIIDCGYLFEMYTGRKSDAVQFWIWSGSLNVIGLAGIKPAKVGLV